VILKARRLAHDDAERERAAAAVKAWLFDQIQKRRSKAAAHIEETVPDQPFAPERLGARLTADDVKATFDRIAKPRRIATSRARNSRYSGFPFKPVAY